MVEIVDRITGEVYETKWYKIPFVKFKMMIEYHRFNKTI